MPEILLSERRGAVALVTLNRPERRNALNTPLLRALEDAFAGAEDDASVEVVVLTGSDPAFCGGVDMKELEETGRAPDMGDPLARLRKPLIGAINGPAVTGGLELALMCDFLIASHQATFADTHARLGLLPGWGQMARLSHAIGTRRAAQMLTSSTAMPAEEAHRCGLVNELVSHDQLLSRTLEVADEIARADGATVRAMLRQLRDGAGMPVAQALAAERSQADEWQGAGFDTTRLSAERERIQARRTESP